MDQPKFFIGLDVGTASTYYAVRSWQGEVVAEGAAATVYKDLKGVLGPYLVSSLVGMEACTGFYPLRDGFMGDSVPVKVANVLKIRELVAKSDPLDARRLSDMLRLGSFPESYIPEKEVQVLRDLVAVRHTFLEERTAAQSRIWAALTRFGIRIPAKKMFSKKGIDLIKELLKKPECPVQLQLLWKHYQDVVASLNDATQRVVGYAKKTFNREFGKLDQIEGVGSIVAAYIIADVHPVTRFAGKKKLRRYAGVIPCFKDSSGKRYGSSLPKSSSRPLLRWALTQAAHGAIRTKTSNLRAYYMLKKKTKKNKAIMAVARAVCDKVYMTLCNS